MITLDQFLKLPAGEIFATGVCHEPTFDKDEIRWVAKKGNGHDDWALYYHKSMHTPPYVAMHGIKSSSPAVIKRLAQVDDDVMGKYRN